MRRQHTIEEQEPRDPGVTAAEVVAHLSKLNDAASIRQIAHGMDLRHHGRRYLPRLIKQLKRSGAIEEIYGGRYRLAEEGKGSGPRARRAAVREPRRTRKHEAAPAAQAPGSAGAGNPRASSPPARGRDPNLIAGRIVAHRDGYGFLVPDHPIPRVDGDLFIGRDGLGDAMNGDHVLARVERRRGDGRAEGRVVQIVQRQPATVVGLFRYGPHGNVVLPYDSRLQHEVAIPPGDELTPELRQKLGADPKGAPA